jgi:type I restriction enzyme S subunit
MSDWKEIKLGNVVIFQRGHDLPKTEMNVGKYPVAGSNGIIGYHNTFTTKAPGITIGRSGNIGTPHFYKEDFWSHNTVLFIKDFKGNSEKFIYYFLKTLDFTQFNTGSAVPSLNRNHIHELYVNIPPLPEQRAIASVLSSFDDKIDLLHRQNQTLEKMAETLFKQMMSEQDFSRLQDRQDENLKSEKSCQSNNPENHVQDKEAKEDWENGVLTDEFDFTMGQSPLGSSFNEEGIGIPMYQGNADFGFRFPTNRVFTTEPTRFAQKHDTLISVRAPVGAQNMANEKCCIGRGVAAFRYKKNNDYYTYTYFKLKSLMEEIKQFNETGTVFGSISKTDFESFSVTIPPEITVYQFQKEVKPIDDKIITNTYQIRTLSTLRDTLLPKLMSGEVRVENCN